MGTTLYSGSHCVAQAGPEHAVFLHVRHTRITCVYHHARLSLNFDKRLEVIPHIGIKKL